MMDETRLALAAISDAATESTDEILAELRTRRHPSRPARRSAVGGPFIAAGRRCRRRRQHRRRRQCGDDRPHPLQGGPGRDRRRARPSAARQPSAGSAQATATAPTPSPSGRAFHAGLDMPAPNGTIVLSAGEGKVTFAGTKSGYGTSSRSATATASSPATATCPRRWSRSARSFRPARRSPRSARPAAPPARTSISRCAGTTRRSIPKTFLNVGKRLARFIAAA